MSELTVLVPTRSRPQNVVPVIQAWHATGAFHVATLVFGIDVDDSQYDKYVEISKQHPEPQFGLLPEWQPLVPKLNKMALLAAQESPIVAFMGDDHLPRTALWAHHLIEDHLISRGQQKIWYGRDGFQDQRLPTWWSMDSRVIQTLGRMVPAPVQHLYCDNAIKVLGEKADTLGYDERILIEHMHPLAGKGTMDAQYERVNRNAQYETDQRLFAGWHMGQADEDARLIRSIGG